MDNNTHNFQNEDYYQDDSSGIITEVPFLAKSYLFLGLAMFVSGLVGLGLGKLTTYYPEIMMYAFYGGAIVVLITSFLININAYKRKSTTATLVAFIIYSIAMGAMISPVFIALSGDVLAISFGITALQELQELYNGKSLVEDGNFALEVLKYINDIDSIITSLI